MKSTFDQQQIQSNALPSPVFSTLIGLPDFYFENPENYKIFWRCLKSHADASRKLPEQIAEALQLAVELKVPFGYPLMDSDCIGVGGCRTLRNILQEKDNSKGSEAERQELVTASQSFVQLKQQCQQARNNAAQQVFQLCMQSPGVTTACGWQREQILAQPCDQFLPEDLSEKLKNLMKNGESHD